jgi:hypothetical protein
MVFTPFCYAEAAANLLTIRRSIRSEKFPNSSFARCAERAEIQAAAE